MILEFLKSGIKNLKTAFKKTTSQFTEKLHALFSRPIDEKLVDELEKLFYEADFGANLSSDLCQKTRKFLKSNKDAKGEDVLKFLEKELLIFLNSFDYSIKTSSDPLIPSVILVVGTNGSGKTSFISKMGKLLLSQGNKVLFGACDTFRAGAQEQISIWGDRLNCEVVTGNYKSDPAAVAFDAYNAAKNRGANFVLIDTAGRLENKTHLMKELEKIRKTLQKITPNSPHETLLVLDANIGQQAKSYATIFHQFVPLTGIVLTKLDGTAKGGAALAIQKELSIPIKFLTTGESADDIIPFQPESFVKTLLNGDL